MKPLRLLLALAIFASSCRTTESIGSRKDVLADAREENYGCFVLYKDGTFSEYKTLVMKTGVGTIPYLLADGKKKIAASNIEAYQTNKHFAISMITPAKNCHSKIAFECLPGFAVRIVKGKINVYDRMCLRSAGNHEYFIQNGMNSPIFDYSDDLMSSMIKYHYEAYNYFHQDKRISTLKKIYTAADLFNNNPSYTKNTNPSYTRK